MTIWSVQNKEKSTCGHRHRNIGRALDCACQIADLDGWSLDIRLVRVSRVDAAVRPIPLDAIDDARLYGRALRDLGDKTTDRPLVRAGLRARGLVDDETIDAAIDAALEETE